MTDRLPAYLSCPKCGEVWCLKHGAPASPPQPAPDALREVCDVETVQTLLDLRNLLHGSMDQQVNDQRTDEDYMDPPPDREYAVNITAKQERDLTQAVLILESRTRTTTPLPSGEHPNEKDPK